MNEEQIKALWLRVTGFDADGDAADIIGFARALLADGGKGEAVAYTTPEAISALSRKSAGMFMVYSFPQKLASVPLYTAPRAEAVALWAAFAPEGNLLAHSKLRPGLSEILNWEPLYRAAPQAECAPREAQPIPKLKPRQIKLVDDEGDPLPEAAPTPERVPREAELHTALSNLVDAITQNVQVTRALGFARDALAAPTPVPAPREAVCDRIVCWHNRRCVNDDAATMRNCPHRAASQAERAPREAQPVDQWLRDLRRAHEYLDKGEPFFTGKDCAELADLIESLAAPTPEKDQRSCDLERADAEKDAARYRWLRGQMGYRRLEELFGSGSYTHEMIDARIDAAILAADKEPK